MSSEYCEVDGASGAISLRFSRSRFVHQRKTRNVTKIPNAIPPNTPPAIAAVLGDVFLLSAFVAESVCAGVILVVPVPNPKELTGGATKGGQALTQEEIQKM